MPRLCDGYQSQESCNPWAEAWEDGRTEAVSIAVALTITTPPPESVDEGPGDIEEGHQRDRIR